MAIAKPPRPTCFFMGVLAAGEKEMDLARCALIDEWGAIDFESERYPFCRTSYYKDEAGENIIKQFFSFRGFFDPGELAARKLRTNGMESDLSEKSATGLPRPINLDPGYLTLAKVVLASAKDFSHRIYLSDGIYAEVTLRYRTEGRKKKNGHFEALEWTFPDYASGDYDSFFMRLRDKLVAETQNNDTIGSNT